MAKIKKTLSDKERELLNIISDTKKKLKNLQEKQKIELGELACKNRLHEFDLTVLDEAFSKLYVQLSQNY